MFFTFQTLKKISWEFTPTWFNWKKKKINKETWEDYPGKTSFHLFSRIKHLWANILDQTQNGSPDTETPSGLQYEPVADFPEQLPWCLSFITNSILVPGWYIGVSMLPFFYRKQKHLTFDIFTELHTELIERREGRTSERLLRHRNSEIHFIIRGHLTQVTVIIAENMMCAPDGTEITDQHR